MEKTNLFSLIAKIGVLITLMGFCMPISCGLNGFQIANYAVQNNNPEMAISLYILFFSGIVSLVISAFYVLVKKGRTPTIIDLVLLAISFGGGVLVRAKDLNHFKAEQGVYFIIAGWVITLVFLIATLVLDKKKG